MSLATLPLRRRRLGTVVILAGVVAVLAGFFTGLARSSVNGLDAISDLGNRTAIGTVIADRINPATPAGVLRHLTDHGLPDGTVAKLVDASIRGGVLLIAAAAGLALLLTVLPIPRGFAGLFAGLGLIGAGAVAGTVVGDHAHIGPASVDLSLGPAIPLCAAGLAAVIAGGAISALRPLAGLFSGVTLAIAGAGLGIVLAIVVGADNALPPIPLT